MIAGGVVVGIAGVYRAVTVAGLPAVCASVTFGF